MSESSLKQMCSLHIAEKILLAGERVGFGAAIIENRKLYFVTISEDIKVQMNCSCVLIPLCNTAVLLYKINK